MSAFRIGQFIFGGDFERLQRLLVNGSEGLLEGNTGDGLSCAVVRYLARTFRLDGPDEGRRACAIGEAF